MSPGYPPQRGAPNPYGRQGQQPGQSRLPANRQANVGHPSASRRLPGQLPAATRTDPSLYQWDRLSTEQQQAVLRTIRLSQRGGMSRAMGVVVVLLVVLGVLAAFAVLALLVFHLSGVISLAM